MLTYADVCLIRVVVSHTQAENGALEALIITNAHVAGLTVGIGAQFTGFTGTNAQILTAGSGARHERTGAQFTCRCSVYLLYWYKRTSTDLELVTNAHVAGLTVGHIGA
jgi:hypothetical protein